jgi:hypothetical protein
MKTLFIAFHVIATAMLSFAIWSGSPMGEFKAHPWDYYFIASLITFLVFCPAGYLALWKKKSHPRFAKAVSIASASAAAAALGFGAFQMIG